MAISRFDLVQGVGMQSLRSRSNCHIEIITQREVLPFDGKPDHNPHPADLTRAGSAMTLAAPVRAVCNTPIAGRSPFTASQEHDIAVLFATATSVYKSIPYLDVYDQARDARTYSGSLPVVAHPPCRAWGSNRNLAKAAAGEKELAYFALDQVRKNGGVLEHPLNSTLWIHANLPGSGKWDDRGGYTVCVDQFWFGHRARKRTLLYIVGVKPYALPRVPLVLGIAPRVVTNNKARPAGSPLFRSEILPHEREATPIEFALWLVSVARSVGK